MIKMVVAILVTLASIGANARLNNSQPQPQNSQTPAQTQVQPDTQTQPQTPLAQAEAEIANKSEWRSARVRVGCNLNKLTEAQCELLPVYEIPAPKNLRKDIALIAGSNRPDLPEYSVSGLTDSNEITYNECKIKWNHSPGNTAERKIIANVNYCVISTRVNSNINGVSGIKYSYSYTRPFADRYFQVTFSDIYYGSEENQPVAERRLKALFEEIVAGMKIVKKSQL